MTCSVALSALFRNLIFCPRLAFTRRFLGRRLGDATSEQRLEWKVSGRRSRGRESG